MFNLTPHDRRVLTSVHAPRSQWLVIPVALDDADLIETRPGAPTRVQTELIGGFDNASDATARAIAAVAEGYFAAVAVVQVQSVFQMKRVKAGAL